MEATETSTFTVRTVVGHEGVEYHSLGCSHRIPVGASVSRMEMTALEIAGWAAEAKSLGQVAPVKPCLRKVIR